MTFVSMVARRSARLRGPHGLSFLSATQRYPEIAIHTPQEVISYENQEL
jgi:hypothetical protein